MFVMGVENFFNWSKIKRGQHGLKLLVVKWVPVLSSGLVTSYRENPNSGDLWNRLTRYTYTYYSIIQFFLFCKIIVHNAARIRGHSSNINKWRV